MEAVEREDVLSPEHHDTDPGEPRVCGATDHAAADPCPAGRVGVGCAWTCDRDAEFACGYTEYCDSEGRVAGLLGRRARLFRTGIGDAPQRFIEWLTTNPSTFGLRGDIAPEDISLELFDASKHGSLFIIRLRQQYRGLPLIGADADIVISGRGEDVRLVSGTVVDGAVAYANLDEQCSAEAAARALRRHAARSADEAPEIELHDLGLYAMAPSRRIVWAARASRNHADLGLFAVDAAPAADGAPPRLVYVDRGVHAALEDEVPIKTLSLELSASPYGPLQDLTVVVNDAISTGAVLTGSTVAGGVQLGSPRAFMRDLHGQTFDEGLATSTRAVSPDGEFLAQSGTEFAAQRIYHLYQSFYDIADRYLSVPAEPALKQWDSYLGAASSFAPGTYQPRIGVFLSSGETCMNQPACAGAYTVDKLPPPELDLPEFVHSADGKKFERIGYTHFRNNDVALNTVAHEFGHVADSFLFPGTPKGTPCMVGVDCVARCEEDTPDEAPALTEAVANLIALLLWYEASPVIDEQDCEAVDWVSADGAHAETPGPCMASLGQIAHMTRDADCVIPVEFCDKPRAPGFVGVCCDLDGDPDCVVTDPRCAGNGGGTKQVPTGACSSSPGYRSNSTLEAFWQLLIGQVCAPEAPFTCAPLVLSGDDSPSEAAARALFYALRVNSRSFRQLFDNVAAYYSCEYGALAYEGVRTVLCNHKIMDCDAPAPLVCGECGDAILDAGEECDLTAIPVACEDLGYDGGELSCSLACELKDDACFHAAPTTGGPTGTGGQSTGDTGGSGTGIESASTAGGVPDPGGCACQQRGGPAPGAALLLGLVCVARASRRARNA